LNGPLHDDDKTRPLLQRGPGRDDAAFAVLLHHRWGVETVRLSRGVTVTVGRGKQADVVVHSQVLSRRHVSLELAPGGVRLIDLGSHNGTLVNGQRVAEAVLKVGDTAEFGGITAVIVSSGDVSVRSMVLKHERFLEVIEEAIQEARTRVRSFSVAMFVVRTAADDPSGVARTVASRFRRALRPIDQLGVFAPGWLEVLLDGATVDEAVLLARQLMRELGAQDDVVRCGVASFPGSATHAEDLLRMAEKAALEASATNPVMRALLQPPLAADDELGQSKAMVELAAALRKVARTQVPVLVLGETGSGKEVAARALHRLSTRAAKGFHAVNCGAIAPTLLEGVLFGHDKGAFTGADQAKKGVFEEAEGGTLFLDEIGELSLQGQAALLRVLETGRFCRLGSVVERTADVRLIAATHRDLHAMMREGKFREDLYFRLETVTLRVPPLRDRDRDVRQLAEKFLNDARSAHGCEVEGFSPETLDLFRDYRWPGNVRELRNVVTRAALMATGRLIVPHDLGERFAMLAQSSSSQSVLTDPGSKPLDLPTTTAGVGHKGRVQAAEREVILQALKAENWNQSAAARRLNMPRRTLAYKMKSFGLSPERDGP
jgi:DNA-binding NtrC family response regulator